MVTISSSPSLSAPPLQPQLTSPFRHALYCSLPAPSSADPPVPSDPGVTKLFTSKGPSFYQEPDDQEGLEFENWSKSQNPRLPLRAVTAPSHASTAPWGPMDTYTWGKLDHYHQLNQLEDRTCSVIRVNYFQIIPKLSGYWEGRHIHSQHIVLALDN